jgi:WD40 repeat protein
MPNSLLTNISRSSDSTIKIWGVSTEKCLHTLTSHGDYVKALAYSPDRGFLASAGLDRDICIWDVETSPAPVTQLSGRFIACFELLSDQLPPCQLAFHWSDIYIIGAMHSFKDRTTSIWF